MPTRSSFSSQSGMTLVEVMLVVFIVGLVAGVAVMTLPDRPDPREKAVKELGRAVRDIQDMSVLTGDTYALRAADGAISLMRWDGFEWQQTGRTLADLPDGVDVRLQRPNETERDSGNASRMLVFDALGASEPAEIVVSYAGFRQTLSIQPDGEVLNGAPS